MVLCLSQNVINYLKFGISVLYVQGREFKQRFLVVVTYQVGFLTVYLVEGLFEVILAAIPSL